MTNEQKYKTQEERIKAFDDFCKGQGDRCNHCEIARKRLSISRRSECVVYWLAIEAEEEKPEPCFYCGNKYLAITKDGNNLWSVSCTACLYESRHHADRDTAIAAHNRMARAVDAAKQGDMK